MCCLNLLKRSLCFVHLAVYSLIAGAQYLQTGRLPFGGSLMVVVFVICFCADSVNCQLLKADIIGSCKPYILQVYITFFPEHVVIKTIDVPVVVMVPYLWLDVHTTA